MKKITRHLLLLALIVSVMAVSASVVFAKELGLLTISGPGIKGEVTLNDPDAMMDLEGSGFFDAAARVKPPADLGEGYHMTAHLNLDGKLVPFVEMEYFPMEEGQAGYVHYTGRLEGEALQPVDEWYTMRPTAESALRELLTANKITLQPAVSVAPEVPAPAEEAVSALAAEPVAAPQSDPVPVTPPYTISALVVGILALLGAVLVLRRRTVSRPTA